MRDRVVAAAAGEVYAVRGAIAINTHPPYTPFDYGNDVRIRHPNGYLTIYGHLYPGTIAVNLGDHVEPGQLLGLSDNTGKSTGPHLHFEVRDASGRRVNPYGDPPDYEGGCGPNALWATCPPTPAPPSDSDRDGYTTAQGDCNDSDAAVKPNAIERCNGRDDDCDRQTDEPWTSGLASDIGQSCTVGLGACANAGQYMCTPDGRATVCSVDRLPPQVERCNQIDDDCDGTTDEDWLTGGAALGQPCTITWRGCYGTSSGVWRCAPDGLAPVCSAPEPTPPTETCNGLDDDCDGSVDNVEVSMTNADAQNCGACGNVCLPGEYCAGGGCRCNYNVCDEYCRHQECGSDCAFDQWCSTTRYQDCQWSCVGLPREQWDPTQYRVYCSQGCFGATW